MRRMNYDRFKNPTNFGEYDDTQSQFVLDKAMEDGVYLLVIKDEANAIFYSSILINVNDRVFSSFSGIMRDGETGNAFYLETSYDRKYLASYSVDGDEVTLASGDIVYLYKLD